jgi:predicted component of viral defense system (DUF524 family)
MNMNYRVSISISSISIRIDITLNTSTLTLTSTLTSALRQAISYYNFKKNNQNFVSKIETYQNSYIVVHGYVRVVLGRSERLESEIN